MNDTNDLFEKNKIVRNQDDDQDSDEEIVDKCKKLCIQDLKEGINDFNKNPLAIRNISLYGDKKYNKSKSKPKDVNKKDKKQQKIVEKSE